MRGVSGLGVGAMHAKSTILYRPGCGVQTSVDEGEEKVVYLSYDFFVAKCLGRFVANVPCELFGDWLTGCMDKIDRRSRVNQRHP